MGLSYNCSFELSGIALLLVVHVFMKVQYVDKTPNSIAFDRFVTMMLVAEILDVICSVMHNQIFQLGVAACSFADTAYFIASAFVEYLLVDYVRTRVRTSSLTAVLDALDKGVLVLYLLLIVINSFTGLVFLFDDGVYTHGFAYAVVYLVPAYFLLTAMLRVAVNPEAFTRKERVSYDCFMLMVVVGMLLQAFAFPMVLLTFFFSSIGTLVLLFGLETPDYPKLRKNMGELEYLQRNLEKEVEKQTALARERKDQVERMSIDTVKALAQAIDAKDDYTRGHSTRVAEYSKLLAIEAGWDQDEIDKVFRSALLHDIGKIGVPDSILNKPCRLEHTEYEVIQTHTVVGDNILKKVSSVPEAALVARSHHERYDGNGYPDGLAGEEIPLLARVVTIADAYDAMSSSRIYRRSLERDAILEELQRGRGTQFDPELLDIFLVLFERGELEQVAVANAGVASAQ